MHPTNERQCNVLSHRLGAFTKWFSKARVKSGAKSYWIILIAEIKCQYGFQMHEPYNLHQIFPLYIFPQICKFILLLSSEYTTTSLEAWTSHFIVLSSLNFAQSMVVWMLCSIQNLRRTRWLKTISVQDWFKMDCQYYVLRFFCLPRALIFFLFYWDQWWG